MHKISREWLNNPNAIVYSHLATQWGYDDVDTLVETYGAYAAHLAGSATLLSLSDDVLDEILAEDMLEKSWRVVQRVLVLAIEIGVGDDELASEVKVFLATLGYTETDVIEQITELITTQHTNIDAIRAFIRDTK
jgi:hypothetical protein